MKGTVSQRPLDSLGDEDRRNREWGPGEGEGAGSGNGGESKGRKGGMEKNMEGRTSHGVLKCLLSQACAVFLKLHRTLSRAVILGWSLPRNMVVNLNLTFLRISMKSPRV